jgi:hypothetical protein
MPNTYTVNSYDVCVQGFERLRTQSEFILTTPISHASTLAELVSELKQDIQCCDRKTTPSPCFCTSSLPAMATNKHLAALTGCLVKR